MTSSPRPSPPEEEREKIRLFPGFGVRFCEVGGVRKRSQLWALEPATRILVWLILLLFVDGVIAFAQETVTIPKARLEELERKEAELERLKQSATPQAPVVRNPKPTGESRKLIAPEQTLPQAKDVAGVSPKTETALAASLPPIEKEEEVSATALAAHYRADAAAADRRYRKRTFKVQGEIVGFEKPPLIRNYYVLLKTSEPQTRIVCDFYPAEKFKAVYAIDGGTVLVGTLPDSRVPIAKVGDKVVIEGRCKGMSGGGVKLTDCELKERKEGR